MVPLAPFNNVFPVFHFIEKLSLWGHLFLCTERNNRKIFNKGNFNVFLVKIIKKKYVYIGFLIKHTPTLPLKQPEIDFYKICF